MSIHVENISGSNSWTETQTVGGHLGGPVMISTYGTWVGTLTIRIQLDGSDRWVEVRQITVDEEIPEPNIPYNTKVEVGFKSGEYTSGIAEIQFTRYEFIPRNQARNSRPMGITC